MALFFLALLPSVVSWCCLVIYIYHSRSASKDDEAKVDADFMNAAMTTELVGARAQRSANGTITLD